jgi:hypothetical protein
VITAMTIGGKLLSNKEEDAARGCCGHFLAADDADAEQLDASSSQLSKA